MLNTKANKKLIRQQVKKFSLLQNNRGLSTHRVPSWFFSAAEPMKPNQQTQPYIYIYAYVYVYVRVFEMAEPLSQNNKINNLSDNFMNMSQISYSSITFQKKIKIKEDGTFLRRR